MSLERLGRYEIKGELGRGAMGIVYRGFDPTIGRTVAIKTILLESGDPDTLKRFRREAQAAGSLSHPNIITIYDAGEDQGLFYIAMELLEGDTLQQIIGRGPLPLAEAVKMVEQVGAALDHAHSRKIIHRDVKPANVIVCQGVAKMMDFGIAKMVSSGMTATGQVLGTPSYMSPEVIKGLGVDSRADIFSLGVVLYEMLTGSKPFEGDNITTVIYKIVGEQPQLPAMVNPTLDLGLNHVVMKALAKNPVDRYQTCAELTNDLKNYQKFRDKGKVLAKAAMAAVASVPAPARAASGTVVMDRSDLGEAAAPAAAAGAPRSKTPLLVLGAVAVVAVIGGIAWMLKRPAQPAPQTAQTQQVAAPAAPAETQPAATAQPDAKAPDTAAPGSTSAATPAAPSESEFQVVSNPVFATIRVDGKPGPQGGWQTPHRFKLPAGKHTIEVSKEGFQAQSRTIALNESGPKRVSFDLAPLTATIEIGSNPPGAEVLLDGKTQSGVTPSRVTIPYGDHQVVIRKQGFREVTRPVTIGANTPPQIQVPLVALAPAALGQATPNSLSRADLALNNGRVVVRVTPRGSSISVDGQPTQYRTPVNFELPPGKHKITVEQEGFDSQSADVTIHTSEISVLEFALKPTGKKRKFPFFR